VLRAGWGGGLPQVLATVRFRPREARCPGCRSVRASPARILLESQPVPGAQMREQKSAAQTRRADWVLLAGGYDVEAVRSVLDSQANGIVGLYRPAYSLTANEKP